MNKKIIIGIACITILIIIISIFFSIKDSQPNSNSEIKDDIAENLERNNCKGDARCISGFVTRIVDGDTIIVGGQSIRFALVDTPEFGEKDYDLAKNAIKNLCPVGSNVLIDEDDKQTEGSYGRIIGVVYCNEFNLNEEILNSGHAEIIVSLCSKSEFVKETWAKNFGC